MKSNLKTSIAVPLSILLGFGMIASAIFFSGNLGGNSAEQLINTEEKKPLDKVRGIDDTDFVRGNPNAAIVVVEYSDYDCTFCKQFHSTMKQIMDKYGVGGKVAWVYRQFPIQTIHPNAPKISEAALCAGDLSGNEAFWTFSDLIFSERSSNQLTNMTSLPDFAARAGVDVAQFNSCLNSGRMAAEVERQFNEGTASGVTGTPYSFVMVGTQQVPLNGAQSFALMDRIIQDLIKQLENSSG